MDDRRAIATRTLFRGEVTHLVTIFEPVMTGENQWSCDFEVEGLDIDEHQTAVGVDAIQAITLAMEGLRNALIPFQDQLRWVGGAIGDVGFYRVVFPIIGQQYADEVHDFMDAKIERFNTEMEKKCS